ncbi:Phytoene synthase [Paracholeplasma brassicae]|uniref:Phytoene synthase n=1 Tax=Acholeplasma brassicae TaxID=61635 RepID=U4KPU5_9MOLU|nr:phytoene/squalene synthase family protein [Paracholeplasma brassicae]CCV66396.1 Phytoene synthase [Paracholeplasma brassicae]
MNGLEPVLIIIGLLIFFLVMGYILYLSIELRKIEYIIKVNSLTFYKAFSSLKSRRQRHAVYAVYAFCRYADDLADEYKDELGLIRLKEQLDDYKKRKTANTLVFRALKRYTRSFYPSDYDYEPFYRMIEGQINDIHFKDIETLEELYTYCDLVAGTVGQMLLPVLSPTNYKELNDFAIGLGRGMQITNILRDIKEDKIKNKRVYLPKTMLDAYGYHRKDIDHSVINEPFIELFKSLSKIAYDSYQQALDQLNRFEPDITKPLGLAIVLYRGILDKAILMNYDVYSCRIVLNNQEKREKIEQFLQSIKGEKENVRE